MPTLKLPQYYKGESGKGQYDQTGYSATSNLDVHVQLGTATCQVLLAQDSATPNEDCVSEILPNGDSFWASTTSGKIWKRTAAGVWSLVHTNGQGANKGIKYFNENLYYMTAAKLGKIAEANASSEASWSSQNDSFGTFTNGSSYKPVAVCNLTLFIGDGKFVARVDSGGTFSANVLDVESRFSVTALENAEGWLLIGLTTSTSVCFSKVVLWDTYSSSWTYEDDLYEIGINAFIPADNIIFISAGVSGNIYYWTGAKAQKLTRIQNVTTSINPYNVAVQNGKALFAIGTKVFSIHKEDKDMSYAICEEFTASTGTIGSLLIKGTTLLASVGTAVHITGTTKATASFTSPVIEGTFNEVKVPYESMPTGCSLSIETNVNGAGWVTETDRFVKETSMMEYAMTGGPTFDGQVQFFKIRVTLTPSGANAPVVKQPIIVQ